MFWTTQQTTVSMEFGNALFTAQAEHGAAIGNMFMGIFGDDDFKAAYFMGGSLDNLAVNPISSGRDNFDYETEIRRTV